MNTNTTTTEQSSCDQPTALFSPVGYTEDGIYAELPEEPLRLYRGAPVSGKHGFSWTGSLAVAQHYAAKHAGGSGDGKVWTCLFDPEDLLAHLTSRGEDEYLIETLVFDRQNSCASAEEYISVQAAAATASSGARLIPHLFDTEAVERWIVTQRDLTAEDFAIISTRIEPSNMGRILVKAAKAGAIDADELATALTSTWSADVHPSTMLSLEQWRFLFTKAGYTQNGVVANRPAKPMRLYRGAPTEGRLGMSWTDNLSTAEFFSIRLTEGEEEKIWTAVFDPEDLLAHITSRDESEYVLDPEALVSSWIKIEEYISA